MDRLTTLGYSKNVDMEVGKCLISSARKDNELLMKIELCGTDVHTYHGGLEEAPFPTILGHEICGTKNVKVDFLGKQVKEGDRIVL